MGGEESREKVPELEKGAALKVNKPLYSMQSEYGNTGKFMIIWVDRNINECNTDCQNTLVQLRRILNEVNACTNWKESIKLLNNSKEKTTFLIVSGELGQQLVSDVHNIPNLDTIFVFCGNKQRHEEWARHWYKIQGVYTSIEPICEVLRLNIKKRRPLDNVSMSIIDMNEENSSQSLNQLDSTFMYSQIFKDILLEINYDQQAVKELAKFCKKNKHYTNDEEKKLIKEFEHTYKRSQAIWWYTRECFTYRLLNESLRTLNGDIIIRMGFFLCDIHRQLESLHQAQRSQHYGKPFQVYRGQGISTIEFNKLKNNKGGLISFNNFLSTSENRDVSVSFAQKALAQSNTVPVLFQMFIDSRVSSTPFASLKSVSYHAEEDEILFSMHTVFRINEIQKLDSIHSVYQVDLTLTSDNDKQLRELTQRIRQECESPTGWSRLGKLLLKIGQFEKAENLYKTLLEQASNDSDKVFIYHQLGWLNNEQGRYTEAISLYETSLKINRKTLSGDHPSLANTYNNIGLAYQNMEYYPKALEYYEKARQIKEKVAEKYDSDMAIFYGNMGQVYSKTGDYVKALEYLEKDLEITRIVLPSNHPNLATTYNNIGQVYNNMHEYSKALEYHKKALQVRDIALPPNHPSLATSYNNIGSVYSNMGQYSEAVSHLEKAHTIWRKSLGPSHPLTITVTKNIDYVKKKL